MDIDTVVQAGIMFFFRYGVPGVLSGTMFALPVLHPPVRKLARASVRARYAMMTAGALIAFIITYVVLAWLSIDMTYIFMEPLCGERPCPPPSTEKTRMKENAFQELFLRELLPLPGAHLCYTTPEQCADADQLVVTYLHGRAGEPASSSDTLHLLGVGLVAMVACAFQVWRFTQPPEPEPAG